jgi:two-component system cell cycle sensor histidine kinase/response regulator CckA
MSDIDAPLKYSEPPADRSEREGSIAMLVLLALGLAIAAISLAMVSRQVAEPFVFAILGGLAVIGVFCLFAGAAGILHFGERRTREDITRAFADNLSDGMMIADAKGSVIYANQAYGEMTGAGGGKPVTNVERAFAGDPQLTEPIFRLMRAAKQGRLWSEDVILAADPAAEPERTALPRTLQISVRQFASPAKSGKRGALTVWQLKDMTAAAREGEHAFEKLQMVVDYLDAAPAGFLSADQQGRIVYMNATLAQWLDLELSDAAAGNFELSDFMSGKAASRITRPGKKSGPRDIQTFAIDLKRRDGSDLPVRVVHRLMTAPDGESLLAHMLVLESANGEMEHDQGDAAALHFARFFESAPVAIATVDGDGDIVSINAAFAGMFGEADGENGRGRIESLIESDARQPLQEAIGAAALGEVAIESLDAAFGSEGGRRCRFFISPIERGDQTEVAILYAIDTTEQRALEIQFAQSQKMQAVGQLAGGIAHDFNNVLTAIIGFSELLLANHRPSDPAFQDIMNIRQNANRAAGLVRQLLAFSRQQNLQPEVLSLGDVLSDLTILLGRLLGEKIDLNVINGRDLWKVKADLHQFEQVVINLAVNARDAMPDGGKLTIRTANVGEDESAKLGHQVMQAGEYVLCEVSDTGCGIPPEVMEKIFEPFFSTKEVGKGTGLGLSTVYGIVKQTGGFIFPESEPGKGSAFRIYLPRHSVSQDEVDAAALEEVREEKQQDLTGTETVLLVEDEEAVRNFASRALASRGYKVLEAGTGTEALEVMKAHDGVVDLVVSDVVMPEMDGPTLARELRESDPQLKIIFISGYAEDAFKKNLGDDEQFVMLPKPFSLKQLVATVKETLGA